MSSSEKTKWVIDPSHSEISFKVKHLMITNVKGVFKEFSGSAATTGNEFLTSEIQGQSIPELPTGMAILKARISSRLKNTR
jgi:polyisoprenoid-binding protein YceI